MKTTKTNPGLADGTIEIYTDASGAPAVLRYNGYAFAFDCLGEITCNNIAPCYGSRRACKVAHQICEREYRALLDANTTAEWRAANIALYAA